MYNVKQYTIVERNVFYVRAEKSKIQKENPRKINKTYEIFKEKIKEKLLKYGFAKKENFQCNCDLKFKVELNLYELTKIKLQ